ncbi:HAD hydrolase-like protein [Desulfosporosinus nitroreducens]|uniref:HAD hydrolase-like protein n=1 Tax=Desulfosporosinus nitroreducens TaxID=2018668 RepID=A0ABT8QNW0_9FIRM|nr:HAD hydrolase-like protein [Desulfosporosinus nitroreducens]MCO1599915.1 HAD hydrolase-like protein [Desulfosporosinus nitroreducens]MDO0823042.1 HAD hydrolase-like protein [Desulfosporosinus nitroreducens]
MRYDILLWDLDGTLTDSKEGITRSVKYALSRLDYSIPEADDLDWIIGPPLKESFKTLLQTTDEALLNQAIIIYRERFREIGLYENIVYPGIPELLFKLKEKGCKHLLATSKPRVFAEKILQHFLLEEYFDVIMGSELNGRFAEKETVIEEVLKRVPGSSVSKTVMIGDRKYDVHGARANQIDVIAVGYGYGTVDELQAANPDFIVPSVEGLGKLLLNDLV